LEILLIADLWNLQVGSVSMSISLALNF